MSHQSSSSSGDEGGTHRPRVEVIFPTVEAAADFVDDGVTCPTVCGSAPTAGSGNVDGDADALVAKALAELPPELAALAEDPKKHARSKDPGWKYGFWPNETKKEMVQCIFCRKVVPSGIKRFKQHLSGGYGDTEKCPKAPAVVRKEMHDYLVKNARIQVMVVEETEAEGEVQMRAPVPSSGTKIKEAKRKALAQASIMAFTQKKYAKSVTSMLCKSPEEIVEERHKSTGSTSQSTLEHCTKKLKESKKSVDDHLADFFYENGIPLNAINSRSLEVLVESIGQYGPGYRLPSYHELRNPLLERAVVKTDSLRKKHEEAWKEYGCSLMSDSWTDQRHRHLINFLANSPAGTFFLGSVDASSEVANAEMLADLLQKQIEQIGKEYVVQVVTDNGANYKAAGKELIKRIPTLFWTPCAAHCLDLLLEDLCKIKEFNMCITNAKKVCRFLYKHGRLLDLMRDKLGGDLVRPAITRFATSFITLASMHRHKQGLRGLFVSDEWHANKLAVSVEGKNVERIVLSIPFWKQLEYCLKASQPLIIALRIADGDETPAAPEIMAAMDVAKKTIIEGLKDKPELLKQVLFYFKNRWEDQMEQKLYGAALFLNPAKFFPIMESTRREATRLRSMFNDVLWKMVPEDEEVLNKISKQADDYERSEGDAFSKALAIKDRNRKNPILWWGAYGGLAYELQSLAKKIVSLCCSASGCERNWSTFSQIHTKRRNRLEHKRLNKLVYVSYNRKMTNRFMKLRELGSKGKRSNPLHLEEFQWENEWVDAGYEPVHGGTAGDNDVTWGDVDVATNASVDLGGRNLPRAAAARGKRTTNEPPLRKRKQPRKAPAVMDEILEEEDSSESDAMDEDEEDEDGSAGGPSGTTGAFQVDVAAVL